MTEQTHTLAKWPASDEACNRLIAAAPDMHAAAVRVLELANAEPFSPLWSALYSLREATNKAEGR